MVYATHVRMVFIGTLGTNTPAPEEFTFSICADKISDLTQTQNDNALAAMGAFFASAGAKISNAAVLREMKSALIGPDGRYVNPFPIASFGTYTGAAAATVPPQVALAVQLRSLETRRSKGRFYLPMFTGQVQATSLQVSGTDINNVSTGVTTALQAINTAIGAGAGGAGGICIASKAHASNYIPSIVAVGKVADTIRRRRAELAEDYVLSAL